MHAPLWNVTLCGTTAPWNLEREEGQAPFSTLQANENNILICPVLLNVNPCNLN